MRNAQNAVNRKVQPVTDRISMVMQPVTRVVGTTGAFVPVVARGGVERVAEATRPVQTRQEPATVFYGRGYVSPAQQTSGRIPVPTHVTQHVQEMREAIAPKPTGSMQQNKSLVHPAREISVTMHQQRVQLRIPEVPDIGRFMEEKALWIHERGVEASNLWTTSVAPAIERVVDTAPYLGPETLPIARPGPSGVGGRSGEEIHHVAPGSRRGELTLVTAPPLTRGGTRLQPNWEGDPGHLLIKGAVIDLPQGAIEYVTAAPLGIVRAGRMAYQDPMGAAALTGEGLVVVGEGTVEAVKEDPYRFTGAMVGGILIGGKTAAIKQRAGATVLRAVAHVDPYFERGMRVYTGHAGPIDTITRWQNPFEYHPTLKGSTKFELDPTIFEAPRSYYHGTSRHFMEIRIREGKIEVASHMPTAIPETRAALAALERGLVEPAYQAIEHALFLGPPDTGYATFASGGFLKIRGTPLEVPKSLTRLAQTREAIAQSGKRVPRGLQQQLSLKAYGEYLRSPRGEILVSPKPVSGYRWLGLPEHEYVVKPGTHLYPVHSGRSRFFQRFGLTRGSSYTIRPDTGQILEIMEFSFNPVAQRPAPPILVDLPEIRAKYLHLPKPLSLYLMEDPEPVIKPITKTPPYGSVLHERAVRAGTRLSTHVTREKERTAPLFGRDRPIDVDRVIRVPDGGRQTLPGRDSSTDIDRAIRAPDSRRQALPGRDRSTDIDRAIRAPDSRRQILPGRDRSTDIDRVVRAPDSRRQTLPGRGRPTDIDRVIRAPDSRRQILPGRGRPTDIDRVIRAPDDRVRPPPGRPRPNPGMPRREADYRTPGPHENLPEPDRKGERKRHRKRRDPYDWFIENPAHDLKSVFGSPMFGNLPRQLDTPGDLFGAPDRKTPRRKKNTSRKT